MLFESTTALLRSIVHSIENKDEPGWDDHLESGNQCLYELHQFARSSTSTYKSSNAKFPVVAPAFERAIRAIPHVKLMMGAIRRRDQEAAVAGGRAAISEMIGIKTALPSVSSIEPKLDTRRPAKRPEGPPKNVHGHKRPAKQQREPTSVGQPPLETWIRHDEWLRHAYPHGDHLVEKRLGNVALIRHVGACVGNMRDGFRLIRERVIYSDSHSGDWIPAVEAVRLLEEARSLRAETTDPLVIQFASDLIELAEASALTGNTIMF